jgi:hypothetical protein
MDLEQSYKKLEEKKKRLLNQKRELKKREDKIKNQRWFNFGKIAEKIGLNLDDDILEGALLEILDQSKDSSTIEKWKKLSEEFNSKSKEEESRLIIKLNCKKSKEINKKVMSLGFRWNSFRSEWYGRGIKKKVEKELAEYNPEIEVV